MEYQTLRGIIALNNQGVSLLEKQCVGQAIETLRDAMELARDIFPTADAHPTDIDKLPSFLLDAARRRANPEPIPTTKFQRCVHTLCMAGSYRPLDATFRDFLDLGVLSAPTAPVYPIIITDDMETAADTDDNSSALARLHAKITATLVLYNLATAYICLPTTTPETYVSNTRLQSLMLFLADDMLRDTGDLPMHIEDVNIFLHRHIACAELLVTRSLLALETLPPVGCFEGPHDLMVALKQVDALKERYGRMRQLLLDMDQSLSDVTEWHFAAAAA